jgi:hypothetical protein
MLHTFLTSALDEGDWSASLSGRFIPGKQPPVPITQETGWAPGSIWTLRRKDQFFDLAYSAKLSNKDKVLKQATY